MSNRSPAAPSTPSDLYISWADYHQAIEQLAVKLYRSQWTFDQILCLARGGLRIGDLLSRIFKTPLAILSTASYSGQQGQVQGSLTIAHHLTMTTPQLGSQVLIVDDLLDSGITLDQTLAWIKTHHGQETHTYRTAVLWWKASSKVAPDFYVHYLEHSPWIHQPFEYYESLSLDHLAQQHETEDLRESRAGLSLTPSPQV
ncbi:phosphoribosyltransferase [Lyngbya confervoides]|uniref:Phosphoribosyltransferase n=1 Tax=Lyngbya confervoides BDU141951 TaxID=1574623 RepID=A0ABD4SZL8_9CYAN|nr:phosphoribosyltransferase family protein [Lyngbya confervoides]MCM1981734.1 phosphoribosyltransferase [Lyngbya confervoides BDU141951]